MSSIEVKDQPGLVRDTKSGAIVMTNPELINKAKERKRLRKQQFDRVDNLADKVESLQDELSDIKQLLKILVENNGKHNS